jgi:hypothetical protein
MGDARDGAAEATWNERTRERRLRRRARRLGFTLNKRRGFSAYYGPNYWLIDEYGSPVLHDGGDPRNRATLDDVEAHLGKVEEMAKGFDWDKAILGR